LQPPPPRTRQPRRQQHQRPDHDHRRNRQQPAGTDDQRAHPHTHLAGRRPDQLPRQRHRPRGRNDPRLRPLLVDHPPPLLQPQQLPHAPDPHLHPLRQRQHHRPRPPIPLLPRSPAHRHLLPQRVGHAQPPPPPPP